MNAVVKPREREHSAPMDTAPADEQATASTPRSLADRLRLPLMIAGPFIVLAAGAYFYLVAGRYQTTDDAYVRAAQVTISSNVAGRVVEVGVHDNQRVEPGAVLFKLDDAPFRIAVSEAEAQLGKARLEVQALKATYRQRQADMAAARETLAYRNSEFARQQRLLSKGIASQAQFDAAQHAKQSAQQQYSSAQQQIAAALAALDGDPDIPLENHPQVMAAQAQLDHAQLNLSYATITAPAQGVVAKVEQLQVGSYINAAQPVFSLISTSDVWIEANFKEVQLAHMQPGQSASVTIDALPGREFTAKVASLSPGTGSEFSLLPAENATGNWVKVVQRVPVRLEIDNLRSGRSLQSGLSAQVKVDTEFRHRLSGDDESAGDDAGNLAARR